MLIAYLYEVQALEGWKVIMYDEMQPKSFAVI